MKTIFSILILALVSSFTYSQNCDLYHPLVKGYSYEVPFVMGPKKKSNGKTVHTVEKVETTNAGLQAKIKLVHIPTNNKPKDPIYYSVVCRKDGSLLVDGAATSNNDMDMIVAFEGGCPLEIPKELSVGYTWPDCEYMKTEKRMRAQVKLLGRKVTGKETITVGNESVEAYVIEFEMQYRIKEGLVIRLGKTNKSWFVTGKGFVKSEYMDVKAFQWLEKW